ncbi:hypothetical protein IC608_01120 [Devosia sp. PTR5]|uniref:HEPN domain-containing protein n=2 Tax=Devosia TaxID=46913 RepID=A0A927FQC4_9HYPH|nr:MULTISPECIES: hypothetical protein [Devosia]MBD8064076.1 hypothetical protein [Devosia oryzisoli]QQR40104.1 hypothetical protein JI748_03570 [Devosia rhizoryzae]
MTEQFTATTPIGFLNKAEAYRAGAQLLARELKGVGGWSGDPTRYLYYHGIELYMKAALISAGKTEDQLRRLGHGFIKLACACNLVGFGLNEPQDLNVLEMIDTDSNYIKARYHQVGPFRVPTVQALDGTAHEIAFLAVAMVRRSGQPVHAPRPALPMEYRFQAS